MKDTSSLVEDSLEQLKSKLKHLEQERDERTNIFYLSADDSQQNKNEIVKSLPRTFYSKAKNSAD